MAKIFDFDEIPAGTAPMELEGRDAAVHGAAQHILRGHLHTKKPPHTEAEVKAYIREEIYNAAKHGAVLAG